jgi:predicted unusual protein kinase regulating ubiquinone biosynthesis (AarF/ABC1/UbiB family)
MEFIDGVQVTDRPGLQRLGIAPGALAQLVSQTFNEMIFIHGDVHCDPHAANLVGACWALCLGLGSNSCSRLGNSACLV